MWYLYHKVGLDAGQVVLVPDVELPVGAVAIPLASGQDRYEAKPLALLADRNAVGNGYSYDVPLGQPIAEISAGECKEEDLARITGVLNEWVILDYQNIRYREMWVPYAAEYMAWSPGELPDRNRRVYHFWGHGDAKVAQLLSEITPSVESLMLELTEPGLSRDSQYVIPLGRWLRSNGLLDSLGRNALRELENATQSTVPGV